jgi:hypothetical protein
MADDVVYSRAYSEQGPDFSVAYRVIKRTKTRIYVNREIDNEGSLAWWEKYHEDRHCFTLDRATFERDGRAHGRRNGLLTTFYATEAQAIE